VPTIVTRTALNAKQHVGRDKRRSAFRIIPPPRWQEHRPRLTRKALGGACLVSARYDRIDAVCLSERPAFPRCQLVAGHGIGRLGVQLPDCFDVEADLSSLVQRPRLRKKMLDAHFLELREAFLPTAFLLGLALPLDLFGFCLPLNPPSKARR
jgi:hypothetical protein